MKERCLALSIFLILYTVKIHAQGNIQISNSNPQNLLNKRWNLSKYVWSHAHRFSTVQSKPALDFDAIDNWVSLGDNSSVAISNNGKYFAYTLKNIPFRNSSLVIQSINGLWKRTFVGGAPGFFSRDNRKYIFTSNDTLCFLNVGSNDSIVVQQIVSLKQPEVNSGEWLAYQLKGKGIDSLLVLQNLITGKELLLGKSTGYLFDKSGTWLANYNSQRKQLGVYNLTSGKRLSFQSVSGYIFDEGGKCIMLKLVNDSSISGSVFLNFKYVSLLKGEMVDLKFSSENRNDGSIIDCTLDRSGEQALFLKQTSSGLQSGSDRAQSINKQINSSLWYWRIGMDKPVLLTSTDTPGIRNSFIIKSASFTNSGLYVLLGLQKKQNVQPIQVDPVNVDVWSFKDTIIQSTQIELLKRNPLDYYAIISKNGGKVICLTDEYEEAKTKLLASDFCVVGKTGKRIYGDQFWKKGYIVDSNWLLSYKNGKRTLIKTKCENGFWFSPNNKYLVYFDDELCQYFSYDIEKGKAFNISTGVPRWQLGYQIPNERYPKKPVFRAGVLGWLMNDKGLLVYDNYDIWKLDLNGIKPAVNITNGYGRLNKIVLRLSGSEEGNNDISVFDDKDTLLLKATNTVSQQNGFYKKILAKEGNPELLYMGSCVLEMAVWSDEDAGMKPLKAANVDTWIVKKQTVNEAPNYFITKDLKNYSPITNIQPQAQYNWFKSELHTFKQLDGTLSQGILYKPENFDSSKKYPVIIGFYNFFSQRLHQYLSPKYIVSPIIEIPWLVSHEYLVFTPDIYNDPEKWGESAYNTIEGAAIYMKSLPFVDGMRLGACGHSHSGRLAYYILTHSNSFAAMSIGSATTDLVSSALSLNYAYRGGSRLEALDINMGSIWQHPELWLSESPLMQANKVKSPLLMCYHKNDVVPGQAIEMFMALRRLEKTVWWLQYDDGHHILTKLKDMKDFTIRATQFYDHYLKAAPPPYWMTKGIPANLKGVESRYDLDSTGNCSRNCSTCLSQKFKESEN